MSANYPSDVTDEQWQVLRKLLPERSQLGRPPIDRRRIVNAVLYLNRSGCQWRMLPLDFPKWGSEKGTRVNSRRGVRPNNLVRMIFDNLGKNELAIAENSVRR